MIRSTATALLLVALAAPPAGAQAAPDDAAPTLRLVPTLALERPGHRWARAGGGEWRMRPGTGPALGAALQYHPGGRLAYELSGSFAATDYALDNVSENGAQQDFAGIGSLQLFRLSAGVLFRLRENIPGFFSAGAGAVYHRPVERFPAPGRDDTTEFTDEAQWMPSAHAGIGYEIVSGDAGVQLDFRVYAVRPGQDRVSGTIPVAAIPMEMTAETVALDYRFSLGYRIGL